MELTATKTCMDRDLKVAIKDLASQDLTLLMPPHASSQYVSSVTSLTLRLPAFDHIEYIGKAYLKIKSDEFIFATTSASSVNAAGSSGVESTVVIIPAIDDSNLKIVIIPDQCLS